MMDTHTAPLVIDGYHHATAMAAAAARAPWDGLLANKARRSPLLPIKRPIPDQKRLPLSLVAVGVVAYCGVFWIGAITLAGWLLRAAGLI